MDLCFDVCKQIITRTDTEKVVNLSNNYLTLNFTFKSNDWTGLTKFILIHHKESVTRIGLVENAVTLPRGLLLGDRVVFTIYGIDEIDSENKILITTNLQVIHLLESGYVDEYSEIIDVIGTDTIGQIYIAINTKADKTYTDNMLATKVSYTDIIDELTSTSTDKVLSAKQGKILKELIDTKANSSDMASALNNKSNVGHNHIKSDITDFAHTHDDRYYTESEMDTSLAGKVNISDIEDNLTSTDTDKPLSANQGKELKDLVDTKANAEEVNDALYYKSNKGHTHLKANITDFAHTHDDRYYTESEIDGKLLLPFPSIRLRSGDIYQFTPSVSKNYVAGGKIFLCMVDPSTTWASGKTVFNVYFFNDEDYVTMYGYNLLYNDSSVTKSFEKGTIYLCYSLDTNRVIFFPLSEMPVDNLTTNNAFVSLSAKQGKVLKELVDGKASSSHTHTKSDITDFTHTHTKSDVTDFAHNHDDRYYTETEVNAIVDGLLNRCSLNSDKNIIQTGDTANLTVYVCENGVPVANREVKFYKVTED